MQLNTSNTLDCFVPRDDAKRQKVLRPAFRSPESTNNKQQSNDSTIQQFNNTMKLREISELLNATVRCGEDRLDEEHETAFASDLMSDVLTLGDYNPVILTGLCNMQTIRTCEMGNLDIIVLVRRKKATEEMIEEAEDEGMVVMESDFSMFKACGLLFKAGMLPIF